MSVEFDFGRIEKSVTQLVGAVEKLEKRLAETGKTASVFDKAFSSQGDFNRFVKDLARVNPKVGSNLANIGLGVDRLARAMKEVDPAAIARGDQMIKFVRDFTRELARTASNTKGIQQIADIASSLRNVGEFINRIDLSKSTSKKPNQFATNFRVFLKDMEDIGKGIDKSNILSKSGQAAKKQALFGLQSFALGIGSVIRNVGQAIAPVRLNKLGQIREVGAFARGLSSIATNLRGVDQIQDMGAAFQNIQKGISGIIRLSESIPQNFGARLVRRFGGIGFGEVRSAIRFIGNIAKELGAISKNLQGLEQLGTLGTATRNISQGIRQLIRIAADIPQNFGARLARLAGGIGFGKVREAIRFIANVAKTLSKELGGVKNIDRLASIGTSFSAIGSFIRNLSTSFKGRLDIAGVNVKGLRSLVKEVSQAINELNRVNVNTKKLDSIGNVLNGIGSRGLGGGGGGVRGGGLLGEFVEDAAAQFVGQAAFALTQKIAGLVRSFASLEQRIANSLRNLGTQFRTFGTTLQGVGRNLLQNFGLETFVQGTGFQLAAEFEDLSNQLTVFGANIPLEEAQAFANEIGIRYPQSANEALRAILDLSKAGQELPAIKDILPSAADLSAIGDISLEVSTQALIAAVGAFDEFREGIPGTFENIEEVSNAISAAADVSTASTGSIVEGLADVGSSANAAGLSLQDTVAILARLEDANIRGSEAGRGLRSLLNSLVRPQTRQELEFLGVAFADQQGNIRNLNDIVKDLARSYLELGFTEEQILTSTSRIADTFGRSTLNVLLANRGFGDLVDRMGEVESAQVRAQRLMESFTGQVEQLQGSVETLQTRAFVPLIERFFTPLVKLGRLVIDFLGTLSDEVLETAGNVVLLGSAVATLGGIVLIAVGSLSLFGGALLQVASSVIGLLINFPKLIAIITTFAASFGVALVAATAFLTILVSVGALVTEVANAIENNIGGAGDAFNTLRRSVEEVFGIIGAVFQVVGDIISTFFSQSNQRNTATFGERLANFFLRVSIAAQDFKNTLIQIGAGLMVFGEFIRATFGGTPEDIANVNRHLEELATLPIIRQLFGRGVNASRLRQFFSQVADSVQRLIGSIQDIGSGFVGLLFGEPEAMDKVRSGFGNLLRLISELIQGATGIDLSDAILKFDDRNILGGLSSLIGSLMRRLVELIVDNQDAISDALVSLFSVPGDIIEGLLRAIGLDNIANFVDEVGNRIADGIRTALSLVFDILGGDIQVGDIFAALLGAIQSFDPAQFILDVANSIASFIGTALRSVPDILKSIGGTLGISQLVDLGISLQDSEVFNGIVNGLSSIAELTFEGISGAVSGISDLIRAVSEGNPVAISAAAGLFVALGGLSAIAGIATAGATIAAIASAFLLVTSAVENLDILLQGDVGGFISTTFSDFIDKILDFVGALTNIDPEQLRGNFDSFVGIIRDVFKLITDELIFAFSDFRARLDQALGDLGVAGAGGFSDQFFGIQEAFSNLIAADFFDALAGQIGSAVDPTVLEAQLRRGQQTILEEFERTLNRFGNIESVPEEVVQNIRDVLARAGLTDEALALLTEESRQQLIDRFASAGIGDPVEAPIPVELQSEVGVNFSSSQTASNIADDLVNNLNGGMDPTTAIQVALNDNLLSVPIQLRQQVIVDLEVQVQSRGLGDLVPEITRVARTGGFIRPEGRANGGALEPRSVYGVHDTPRPEVAMFSDGTSLLFTGQSGGRMLKIMGMAAAPAATLTREQFAQQTRALGGRTPEDIIAAALAEEAEMRADFDREDRQRREKEQLEDQKEAAEFAARIQDLEEDASDSFIDAIIKRNSTQAQEAQRRLTKEKAELLEDRKLDEDFENQQEALDEKHRKEDLEARILENRNRAQEDARSAQERLDDQEQFNDASVNEDQYTYNEMFQDQMRSNDQMYSEQRSANDQEVSEERQTLLEQALLNAQAQVNFSIFMSSLRGNIAAFVSDLAGTTGILGTIGGIIDGIFGSILNPAPTPPPAYGGGGFVAPTPFARGGTLNPFSVGMLHDTNTPEIARIGGRTYLFTGSESARITPLTPNQSRQMGGGITVMVNNDFSGMNNNLDSSLDVQVLAEAIQVKVMDGVTTAVEGLQPKRGI